jgi:hypothetical protein
LHESLGALPLFADGMSAWVGAAVGPSTIRSTLERMLGPERATVPADFVSYRQQLWTVPRSLVAHARQRLTDAGGLRDVSAHLRDVKVPAVVLGCSEDPEEGRSLDSRRLAGELPQGRLVWLEGCGHYVQYGRRRPWSRRYAPLRRRARPAERCVAIRTRRRRTPRSARRPLGRIAVAKVAWPLPRAIGRRAERRACLPSGQCLARAAQRTRRNCARTVFTSFMRTVQVEAVPLHAPDHPAKAERARARAVSVTSLPGA